MTAENSAISGIAISNAAQIVAHDDHNSAADAARALQRLSSQDKVMPVIASYTSEVALAFEPWAGRLKLPT